MACFDYINHLKLDYDPRSKYNYFERNEDMHVLFIFGRMDYIGVELRNANWRDGYRYVTFDGRWFTTIFNIHNEWKDDKRLYRSSLPKVR